MQIHKVHSFKSNTLADTTAPATPPSATSEQDLATQTLAEAFNKTGAQNNQVSSLFDTFDSSPAASGIPPAVGPDGTLTPGASSSIPTPENLLMENPSLRLILDKVAERYQNKKEELLQKKAALEKQAQTATPDELAQLNQQITQINSDVTNIIQYQARLAQMQSGDTNIFAEELDKLSLATDFKHPENFDLNGDGWIGKPKEAGSYAIMIGTDGTKILADYAGNPITSPFPNRDPWKVSKGGVDLITKDQALAQATTDDDEKKVDAYMQLSNPGAKDHVSGTTPYDFNAQIGMNIPPYIWVKKDKDGTPLFDETDASHAVPKEFVQSGTEISQEVPSKDDMKHWMQMRVAKVIVESVKVRTVDGKEVKKSGYAQDISFLDADGKVLATFRVVGKKTGANPGAVDVNKNTHYVFASTVQMHLDASGTEFPIDIEADGMKSTGRTRLADYKNTASLKAFYENLGIPYSPGAGYPGEHGGFSPSEANPERNNVARQAAEYNINDAFLNPLPLIPDPSRQNFLPGSGYNDVTNETTSAGYTSVYMDDTQDNQMPGATVNDERTLLSGIVVTQARGIINVANGYNNIVTVKPVDQAKGKSIDKIYNKDNITRADQAEWKTVVHGGSGRTVVVDKGAGDLYAEASFVWKESSSRDDMVYIRTSGGQGDASTHLGNPKNFIHVHEGGGSKVYIDNPLDLQQKDVKLDKNKQPDPNDPANLGGHAGDDYYDISGARAKWSYQPDADIPGASGRGALDHNAQTSSDAIGQAFSDAETKIWDEAIHKRPDEEALKKSSEGAVLESDKIYTDSKNSLDAAFAAMEGSGVLSGGGAAVGDGLDTEK